MNSAAGMPPLPYTVGEWKSRGPRLMEGQQYSGNMEIPSTNNLPCSACAQSALAWSSLHSSGSRNKSILHYDIRAQEDDVSKLTGHKSEVCGFKWSYDNHQLAFGGNDNRLSIWNPHSVQ
ncbi:unnamed protein product [Urochloa humidicola]